MYNNNLQILDESLINPFSQFKIPNDLNYVRVYLKQLTHFLMEKHSPKIKKGLQTMYGFNPMQRMTFIHGYDNEEEDELSSPLAYIIEEEFFEEF